MQRKKLLLFSSMLIGVVVIFAFLFNSAAGLSLYANEEINNYSLSLSNNHNHLSLSTESVSGTGVLKTQLGNDIEFEYNGLSFEENIWQKIDQDGSFQNTQPISGINEVSFSFSSTNEQAYVYWSNSGAYSEINRESINSNSGLVVTVDFNNSKPNYVKFVALTECHLSSCSYSFECFDYHSHNSSHAIIHYDAKEATCEESGHNEYDACTICSYSTYIEYPALGHDYEEVVDVTASSSHVGRKHDECSRCNKKANYSTIRRTGVSYIEISTFLDFKDIPANTTNNYILTNDINFSGKSWTPITFRGIFDGGYHIISNTSQNLFVNNYGTIENCVIINSNTIDSKGAYTINNYGTINMCSFSGDIYHLDDSYTYVGGIASVNVGTIENCHFNGSIVGITSSNHGYSAAVGGITGTNSNESNKNTAVVKNCYSTGSIYAEGNACSGNAGGIIGTNYYYYKEASHCYFSGSVEGKMLQQSTSYSAGVGAIIGGYNSGTNCYYLDGTSIKVTNGRTYYNGTKMSDYNLMVSSALGDSDLYNYCPKNSNGDPVIPNSYVDSELENRIILSDTELSIAVGESKTIMATVVPSSLLDEHDLVWESSDSEVASVNNGVILGVSIGATTITVSCGDVSSQISVEVTAAIPVSSVSLSHTSISLPYGTMTRLTATISPSNATNKGLIWESSNSSVASYSDGYVIANGIGTATITVRTVDGNKEATCTVTISANLSLSYTNLSISVNQSISLTATLLPSYISGSNISWSSSNTSIARASGATSTNNVSSVTITGLKAGSATISATYNNITALCYVTVSGSGSGGGDTPTSNISLTTSNYSSYLNVSISASNNGTTGSGINTYKVIRYTVTVTVKSGYSIVSSGSIRVSITTTSYSGSNAQTSHTTSVTISLQSGQSSSSGTVNETLSYPGTSITYNYTKTVSSISGSVRHN